MELLLGDEDVWCVEHEYRPKKPIPFDPTVGSRSKFYRCCFPYDICRMATRRRGCLISVELECRLKRAIPFDLTVGSLSNFYGSCFP